METKNRVLLCLGSNKNKNDNIECATEILRTYFPTIVFSDSVYTDPFGSSEGGDTYLNRVAIGYTSNKLDDVKAFLKQAEITVGRTPEDKQKKGIPIDIDLLQWNEEVLKPKDMKLEFVINGLRALSFTR